MGGCLGPNPPANIPTPRIIYKVPCRWYGACLDSLVGAMLYYILLKERPIKESPYSRLTQDFE